MMDSARNVSRAFGLALGVPSKTLLSLQEEDIRDVTEGTLPTPPAPPCDLTLVRRQRFVPRNIKLFYEFSATR
jgi:hypothetical protein